MSKRSCFRTPFWSKRVNESQAQLISARQHFFCKFPSIWNRLSQKNFLLLTSEILRLLVSTFTADDKYSRHFREPVQRQLFKKPKTFYENFIAFFRSTLQKKKNELHSLNISEIIDSEERGYLNAWKILFQNTPRK